MCPPGYEARASIQTHTTDWVKQQYHPGIFTGIQMKRVPLAGIFKALVGLTSSNSSTWLKIVYGDARLDKA